MRLSSLTIAVCNFTRVMIMTGGNFISERGNADGILTARRTTQIVQSRRLLPARHAPLFPLSVSFRSANLIMHAWLGNFVSEIPREADRWSRVRTSAHRPKCFTSETRGKSCMKFLCFHSLSTLVPFYLCLSLLIRFSCRKFRFMTYNSAGRWKGRIE